MVLSDNKLVVRDVGILSLCPWFHHLGKKFLPSVHFRWPRYMGRKNRKCQINLPLIILIHCEYCPELCKFNLRLRFQTITIALHSKHVQLCSNLTCMIWLPRLDRPCYGWKNMDRHETILNRGTTNFEY